MPEMGKAAVRAFASKHDGKGDPERLAEGEAILSDRNAGMPASEMCAKYGVSKATLYRRIDEAIAARIVPTVDAYREQQNAALDDLLRRWQQQVDAAEVMVSEGTRTESMALVERGMKMRAEALGGILRVQERRARLMGTDAPVKVEATVEHTGGIEVSEGVASLIDRVRAARLVS